MLNKIESSVKTDLTLAKLFRPYLVWLQIIGIYLPIVPGGSVHWKRIAWAYSAFWFFLNLGSHVHYLIHLNIDNSTWKTRAYSWNDVILYGNYTILNIGTHVGLAVILQRKWAGLWHSLHHLERALRFDSASYFKCRRIVLGALIYLASKQVVYLGYFGLNNVQLMVFYPTSALVFFWILSFMLSISVESLRDDVVQQAASQSQLGFFKSNELGNRLRLWRRQHAAVYECVEELNECFGLILLIKISYIFLGVINQVFYILVIYIECKLSDFIAVYLFIDHLIQLAVTCYLADRVRFQASNINRYLLKFQVQHPIIDKQIKKLMTQITRFKLRISAMHLFTVHSRLFPTMIGTFLTYVIILYQFQASEETRQNRLNIYCW